MQSEWNQGAAAARDNILANIIGMQNEKGESTREYVVLQELLEHIIDTYGDFCQPYKA